ncbi:MAG: hypothetical protein RQ760_15990 [Sedimentisphaerales bacterium]|nr:hypothetical protein [Sedimentisphaerales bacterium]
MKQKARNKSRGGNRFFNHLAAEKKKAVLALCLISLMAFMWIKVLTKTSPQAAEAELIAELIMETQSEPELEISFIELPRVAGRNDMVTRDFFASDGWQSFVGGRGLKSVAVEEIDIVSKNDDQEVIRRKVADNLKLEAIVSSEDSMAFINDKVLRAGDKMFVRDGNESYECEVVEIKENIVVIRCMEAMITLKMTQVN